MKQRNDLHDLIQSLSKSEKRYFRLYTSLYEGEKDYLHVFDILEAQENYDEEALRVNLKDKVALEHLHVTKNYLFNLIIKALKSYTSAEHVEDQIRDMLHSIRMLYDRKIYSKAESMLRKAKRIAKQHDKMALMLDILAMETLFHEFYYGKEDMAKIYENNMKERNAVLTSLSDFFALNEIYQQANTFHLQTLFARTPEQVEHMEQLMSHPVFKKPPTELSFKSRVYYYGIHRCYYMAIGKLDEALVNADLSVQQYELAPEILAAEGLNYMKTLYYAYHAALNAGEYEASQSYIDRMQNASPSWRGIVVEEAVAMLQLNLYLTVRQYDNARPLIPFVEQHIRGQENAQAYVAVSTSRLQLAHLYFALGEYDKALNQLNQIIAMKEIEEALTVFANARLLNLLVHFELGNLEYLPHLARTTYQYFYKRNNLYRTEKLILSYLKLFARAESESERHILFKKCLSELIQLQEDPFERLAFKEFPYIWWLEKKIATRSRSATGS